MNKTVEILKDIDDVLKEDNEKAEDRVTIVQNTQEVIRVIEEELSTNDEGEAKEKKVDLSPSFDETTVKQNVTDSSVQLPSLPDSESEQKVMSDSGAFKDVQKSHKQEILNVQQTGSLGESHGYESDSTNYQNIAVDSSRKELTEGLSAIAHNNSRESRSFPSDNISIVQTDISSETGGIDIIDKHHALCVGNLQDEIEPPHKRFKTIDTAEKKYSDAPESFEQKHSSPGDILYTATHVVQKDILLQTQESNTEEHMEEMGPDGTCLMTNSNDNCIRVFNTPEQLYSVGQESKEIEELTPVLKMKETDIIYDYCWYSKMMSCDPDSACLAVTSKGTPVHLYDAFTGDLRCSFRAFNHVDQLVAAYCVSFDLSGEKLYCGFNKMVRVFDVTRPGRDCVSRPTFAKEGQSGIISCIAHSPTEIGLYAAGSYSRSIALYSEPEGEMICMFDGQQGGVTHIMFSPDGSKLYSGGRKDNEILCWDLRNPGQILYTLERKVSTNQRIYFDITLDGRYLVSGCHDGQVRVWDTLQAPVQIENCQEPILQPIMSYQGHSETVNGISLNPCLPVVATSSGQRHFPSFDDSSDENTDTEEEQIKIDNSLRLWWIT